MTLSRHRIYQFEVTIFGEYETCREKRISVLLSFNINIFLVIQDLFSLHKRQYKKKTETETEQNKDNKSENETTQHYNKTPDSQTEDKLKVFIAIFKIRFLGNLIL